MQERRTQQDVLPIVAAYCVDSMFNWKAWCDNVMSTAAVLSCTRYIIIIIIILNLYSAYYRKKNTGATVKKVKNNT